MKNILVVAALVALGMVFSAMADAAPFLSSDPATVDVTHCVYQEGSAAAVSTAVFQAAPSSKGQCKADLAGVSVGTHSLQVWFRNDVWGTESAKVPFAFARPAAGGTGPAGLAIEK